MAAPKENRYIVCHAKRGVYLGNGWWSNGPEAEAVNYVPTYSARELSDGVGLKDKDGNPTGGFAVLVGHEHIDMKDNYMSMAVAIKLGKITRPWCNQPAAVQG